MYIHDTNTCFFLPRNHQCDSGLPSREQLISPECSQHQVLSLPKMLVVNKQKKIDLISALQSAP